jgi:16S rRNA processing protein RimM
VTESSASPVAAPREASTPSWPDDAVEVGRILGAWGVKGALKVAPFADDPQALSSATWWFLKPAEGPMAKPVARTVPPALQVRAVREQGETLVVQAAGIADRDTAEGLKGVRVFVSRSHFPATDPGEFYWVDLIGLSVANREGVLLGEVVGLIDTGPHCVLRVRAPRSGPAAMAGEGGTGEESQERLIPFVEAYVDSVDMPGRRIVVDWGLDY